MKWALVAAQLELTVLQVPVGRRSLCAQADQPVLRAGSRSRPLNIDNPASAETLPDLHSGLIIPPRYIHLLISAIFEVYLPLRYQRMLANHGIRVNRRQEPEC